MRRISGILFSMSFFWFYSSYASETTLPIRLAGRYKGDVATARLTNSNLVPNGHLVIDIRNHVLEISFQSVTGKTLSDKLFIEEIKTYFNEEKIIHILDDGTREERVSFQHGNSQYHGFQHKWVAGRNHNVWAYQFKLQDGHLKAVRIQEFRPTGRGEERTLALFEIRNFIKIEGPAEIFSEKKQRETQCHRTDWDF